MNTFLLDTMLTGYDTVCIYNTKKHILKFFKYFKKGFPLNQEIATSDYRQYFSLEEMVYPDDQYLFTQYFNSAVFLDYSQKKESGQLFAFRMKMDDQYIWTSVHLFIPDSYSDDQADILVCQRKLSDKTTHLMEIMSHYNKRVYKIIKCNFALNDFEIIKQRTFENYISRKNIKGQPVQNEWQIEESLVYGDDLPIFHYYTNPAFIEEYYRTGNTPLSFFYRRKIASTYHWVRSVINPSSVYTNNNPVYYFLMEDLDHVLNNLLERFSISGENTDLYKDNYHDNLLYVLSHFTQKYIDFTLLDLKNDIYSIYKFQQENILGNRPIIGNFTERLANFTKYHLADEESQTIMQQASSSELQKSLMHKNSLTFIYTTSDQQKLITVCTKIESEQGVPTKVVIATKPYQLEHLLKVRTFGNFDVFDEEGNRIKFTKKQSKQLLAYLVDRRGFPVSTRDVAVDVLERDPEDINAIKYVSRLSQLAIKDLKAAGYENIILKEWNSLRVDVEQIDCDYYHLMNGDNTYLREYHNEYMKEYSWAEETNAEIMHYTYL